LFKENDMSNEIRVAAEGSLWWVQASGSGRAWATAATPVSGLMGLVTDFSFPSGATITTINERGIPNHHKMTERARIDIAVTFGWTGTNALPSATTGAGASVPMFHLEFKAIRPEDFVGSGYYYQFHGAALQSFDFKEAKEGDNQSVKFAALAMTGPTASGYLS
jgi:hypothetical protein